jgi:bacillithiol biosynthesis deacetylase BshB1
LIDALAIAAHPDDAELFCGGTLALLSRQGYKVGICDLTRGELATQGTPDTRSAEAKAASDLLKLAHRENLSLPDGGIFESENTQVDALCEVFRRLKPELLLAPYFEDRHPDHAQASRLVDRAVFFANLRSYRPESGEPHQILQVLYYQICVLSELSCGCQCGL